MGPFNSAMSPCSGNAKITDQEDGAVVFRLKDESGDFSTTRYHVFPGIDIIYNDVHMPRRISDIAEVKGNMIEIDHCREGRLECQIGSDYFYLAPGDISIHRLGGSVQEEIFPTSHYHGITIQIDLDKSPKCLACILEDVDVEPAAIAQKFQLDHKSFFAMRQLPAIEHIFSELYAVPNSVKKGYLKVKVLEIFLFLSGLELEGSGRKPRCFSQTQVTLAKDICDYLMKHLEQHITTAELALHFGISTTHLKKIFLGVYGTTVYSYIRRQRMQAAAELLQKTDRTVLDIASQFGYENSSKFASAFRSVMGVSPCCYRKGIYHAEA